MRTSGPHKGFSALGIFVLAVLFAQSLQGSSIIPVITPIPDSEVLINFDGTGLDWVYAGPVAPDEFGTGQIEQASYRAAEGWRNASASEWALRPQWTDFIKTGYTAADFPGASGTNDHTKYKFTSEYWSTFTWVDLIDAANGNITNGTDIGSLHNVYETWYVRTTAADASAAAPLPSTAYSGLGLLGIGALLLRRHRADAST